MLTGLIFLYIHILHTLQSYMRIQSYFVSDILGISVSSIFENQPNLAIVYSVNREFQIVYL